MELHSFKDLLKYHRENAGLSKSDLARHIDKTDGYIRKIENDGYTPPILSVCQALADKLELSDTEKTQFLEYAFMERIKSDAEFLNHLSLSSKSALPHVQPITFEGNLSQCSYLIHLAAKSGAELFTENAKPTLEKVITTTLNDSNQTLVQLTIHPSHVWVYISVSPNTNIHDFIKGFMTHTSGIIRDHLPKLSRLPSIWAHQYEVFTIGSLPESATLALTSESTISIPQSH